MNRSTDRRPDIAGKGIANPIAMIGSFGMALRYSFGLHAAADRLIGDRRRPCGRAANADILGEAGALVSTREMGAAIIKELAQQAAESLTDEEN